MINKILNLIETNQSFANKLFEFYESVDKNKDLFDLLYPKELHKKLNHICWLYFSSFQEFSLIGIDSDNNAFAITDNLDLRIINGFQNLPYEIIRVYTGFHDTVDNYFQAFPETKQLLKEYETWCRYNNIPLDEHHIYHDEDGNLFNEYFEINGSIVDREDISNADLILDVENLFGKNIE